MPFHLAPCRITDGHAIAITLLSAYRGDPFTDCLYPTITFDDRVAGNTARYPRNFLRNGHHRHIKVTDEASGLLVGYAKWEMPAEEETVCGQDGVDGADGKPESSAVGEGEAWRAVTTDEELASVGDVERVAQEHIVDGDPKGFCAERGEVVGPRLEEGREAAMGKRRFLALELLATHPDWRRRGVATILLRHGIRLADEMGLPIYLDATPIGKPLYEAEGFREVGNVVHDLSEIGGTGQYTHYFMVREPKSTKTES